MAKRINQVAIGDDTSSSISTRDRDCSDASQDMTSMAEGDMGDLEDNQPDSSAPEDEQADHSPQLPIGKCDNNKIKFSIPEFYSIHFASLFQDGFGSWKCLSPLHHPCISPAKLRL